MDNGLSPFVWRFPVAFQIIPLIFLFAICWFFPESPRWLVKVGRLDEARYILGRLRGEEDGMADAEFNDICNIAKLEREAGKGTSYFHMFWDVMPKFMGGGSSGNLHIGRRVQLVIWLQILQEWIGIAGVTICKFPSVRLLRRQQLIDLFKMPTTSSAKPATLVIKLAGLPAPMISSTWFVKFLLPSPPSSELTSPPVFNHNLRFHS